ncbi:CMRF35-like molecule 8 [Alosa sapidissima]|uniref:CMRF35-like molecule 8 n=1 Tax=Alosa sapidissima TaxID=34773 RepID=UPI001C07F0FF|nr:CMRF35-like molecule 8 [Alosa sapidissima]
MLGAGPPSLVICKLDNGVVEPCRGNPLYLYVGIIAALVFIGLLIMTFILLKSRTNRNRVRGHEGGNAVINCPYQQGYEPYPKYLLKGAKYGVDVIWSDGQAEWTHRGRVSLQNKKDTHIFTVTIHDLTLEDAGTYGCGVDTGEIYNKTLVKLTVVSTINTTTRTLSNTTESERTTHLHDQKSPTSDGHPLHLIVGIMAALVLFGLLVMTFRLIMRRARNRAHRPNRPLSSARKPRAETADYENYPQDSNAIQSLNPNTTQSDAVYQSMKPNTTQSDAVYQSMKPNTTQPDAVYQRMNPNTTQSDAVYQRMNPNTTQPDAVYQRMNPNITQPDAVYQSMKPNTTQLDAVYQSMKPNTTQPDAVYQRMNPNTTQPDAVYQSMKPNTTQPDAVYQRMNPNITQPDAVYQSMKPNTTQPDAASRFIKKDTPQLRQDWGTQMTSSPGDLDIELIGR